MMPPRDTELSLAGHGRLLLSLVEDLDCPFGLERSVKLAAGGINEERFLASLHKSALGADPRSGFIRLARAATLPDPSVAMLADRLDEADIVHLGYEGGPAGGVCKIYLEFSQRVRAIREGMVAPGDAELVHLAVKWRPETQAAALSRYLWPATGGGAAAIAARLSRIHAPGPATASVTMANALVVMASRRCREADILFMEVEEEGSARRSFDINLYAAGLDVASIEAPLRKLAAAYGLARLDVEKLLARIGGFAFGHLSGGIGRDGEDFATVYFGVEGRKGRGRE